MSVKEPLKKTSSKVEESFVEKRALRAINIAIIGHVDHGKTSLVVAILKKVAEMGGRSEKKTYEEIDRAQGGAGKGITITTYVTKISIPIEDELDSDGKPFLKEATITDCPGHKDYIKNMITGTAGVDGVIVVIANTKGVQEQTEVHLAIAANQVSKESIVTVVNNMSEGEIDPDEEEFIKMDIRNVLEKNGFSGDTPIFSFSARKVINGDPVEGAKCVEFIKSFSKLESKERDPNAPLFAPIDNVHTIPGIGTVVTTTVVQGTITPGQSIIVKGHGKVTKLNIVKLHHFHKEIKKAFPGMSIGLNLRIDAKEVERGDCLMEKEGDFKQCKSVVANLVMADATTGRKNPFAEGYKPQIYAHKADTTGRIAKILNEQGDAIELARPGEIVNVRIDFEREIVIRPMEKITIREGGLTVAKGIVTEAIED